MQNWGGRIVVRSGISADSVIGVRQILDDMGLTESVMREAYKLRILTNRYQSWLLGLFLLWDSPPENWQDQLKDIVEFVIRITGEVAFTASPREMDTYLRAEEALRISA